MSKETDEVDCPECGGSGLIIEEFIEPECCGHYNSTGSCCGNAIAKMVGHPAQCKKCEATGTIPPSNKTVD